jgi:hypothetical protein
MIKTAIALIRMGDPCRGVGLAAINSRVTFNYR